MVSVLWLFIFVTVCAILNRARGSKFFDLTTSTAFSRIVSTNGMGVLVGVLSGDVWAGVVAWLGLFLWSVPEWGKYVGATCGNPIDPNEKGFLLSELVLKKVSVKDSRVRGLIGTAVRMSLASPTLLAISIMTGGNLFACIFAPLMALSYYVIGLFVDSGRAWKYGEYLSGGILGGLLFLSIQ